MGSSLAALAQDIPLVWPKANEAHIIFGSSFALMRPGRGRVDASLAPRRQLFARGEVVPLKLRNKGRFFVLSVVNVGGEEHGMNKIAFVALGCLALGACATPTQTVGTAGGVVGRRGDRWSGRGGSRRRGRRGGNPARLCARRSWPSLQLPRPIWPRSTTIPVIRAQKSALLA